MVTRKADEIRASASRVRQRHKDGPPVVRAAPPVRDEAKVRRTVDLDLTTHRELIRWCVDTADELGALRVTGQDVFTLLVRLMLDDPSLAERVKIQLGKGRP